MERIKQNVHCPWEPVTVDTFKAGDPDTEVTGIATTCLATLDIPFRVAAMGGKVLHPGKVLQSDPKTFVAEFEEPIAPAVGSDVNAYGAVNNRFFQQGAVVTELVLKQANSLGFRWRLAIGALQARQPV